jgi:hypothetical protein
MPLSRDQKRQPDLLTDPQTCRFPLTDGRQEIWGEIPARILDARGRRDLGEHEQSAIELFDHYRRELEALASQLFDAGTYGSVTGETLIKIPHNRF